MPPPFTALLLLCASRRLAALPSHGKAEQSKAFAFRRGSLPCRCHASRGLAKLFPRSAERCCSVAPHCCAVLRRRGALHSKAVAHQVTALLLLRLATPCYAVAHPITAPPFLRPAALRKAMPSLPVPVHRRCMPRLCFAVALLCIASPSLRSALLLSAVAVPGTSWPSYPMPLHFGSLPVDAIACRCLAPPSPVAAPRCSTAADQRHSMPLRIGSLPVPRGAVRCPAPPSLIAPMLCRRLGAALPCSSLATLDIAVPILRRSRLSRAFPSPRRAKQIPSFAALGLAGLLRRRAARRCALPFRRLPEQINALPLPILATHCLRHAWLSRASQSPGFASPSLA